MIKIPNKKAAIRAYSLAVMLAIPFAYVIGFLINLAVSIKDGVSHGAHLFASSERGSIESVKWSYKHLSKSLKTGEKFTEDEQDDD